MSAFSRAFSTAFAVECAPRPIVIDVTITAQLHIVIQR